MPEVKVKVYGLNLTRQKYVIVQLLGFLWLLILYTVWRFSDLADDSRFWFVSHLDLVLLLLYLYGLAETFIVLRKFKRAEKGDARA